MRQTHTHTHTKTGTTKSRISREEQGDKQILLLKFLIQGRQSNLGK